MKHKWMIRWMIMIGMVISLLALVLPTRAQEPTPTPENDANCVACHSHEYYVYDTGKWFCLCDAPMHCVYCHGGRTDSMMKDIAHEGIVLYPTRNHAERCQACHTEDYTERVVTFETVAGVSASPYPLITATPITIVATIEQQPPWMLLRLGQLGTWRLAGLGLAVIAFFVMVFLGYRCWKADCLARNNLS